MASLLGPEGWRALHKTLVIHIPWIYEKYRRFIETEIPICIVWQPRNPKTNILVYE